MPRCSIALALVAALTGACGAGGGPLGGAAAAPGATRAAAAGGPTYHADIAPLLQARCGGCHAPDNVAPFALLSFADARAHLAAIRQAVADDTMPPWLAADGCNDYAASAALLPAEKAQLLDWIDTGAAEGTAGATPATVAARPTDVGAFRVDLRLALPQPYLPQQAPDEYRCFVLPWPLTKVQFVTGFDVRPGNPSIVHHAHLYTSSLPAYHRGLDGADGNPGFACGASPVGVAESLASWNPGSPPSALSADGSVGTRLDPNVTLVLQVHYHADGSFAGAVPDQSAVSLQLADAVAKEGFALSLVDPRWLVQPASMLIPAGAAAVTHGTSASPFSLWNVWSKQRPYTRLAVYGVGAHMHLRGQAARLDVQRAGGSPCLLQVDHWNLHWEGQYVLQQPVVLQDDDVVRLACTWNNSAAAQPLVNGVKAVPTDLVWGENSGDEMCAGDIYVAPP